MEKIKIGVLCPSEIATRRFMPALLKSERFEYVGISCAGSDEWFGTPTITLLDAEKKKAESFREVYGGKVFGSYQELISSDEVNAVYIPLPPRLHYKWAKLALENGKNVLLEKPFTDSLSHTEELISIAREKKLAVHENYMFVYHTQLGYIKNLIESGEIGDIRLIRIDFGFPFRGSSDFRYSNALGGGALLDCGGYTVKLATELLGKTARVTAAKLNRKAGFDVDMYGNATIINDDGLTTQISFGMDNDYKCSLEVWGSEGSFFTNRILTAPDGFEPVLITKKGSNEQKTLLPSDDTFMKSIEHFAECVNDANARILHYEDILNQATLIERIAGGKI